MLTASRFRTVRTGLVFSLALAFVVLVAIGLYADFPRMLLALASFRWSFLPLILSLTLFNYCFRFFKWQYYLQRLQIRLPRLTSFLIFLSGLSMAITPGKVGELLKSYLLKRSTGEPISRTAPIIMAERLSDGLAMLLLAATGLVFYRFGWEVLLSLLVVGLGVILLIQHRPLSLKVLAAGERLPVLSRLAQPLRAFYESAYTLLRWRPLLLAIAIGFLSWSGECLALYFVFLGLGLPASPELLLKATFILAVSSLVGSASGLPGGLGTADGSLLGLIRLLVSPSAVIGGAATLLIRFCTLWFGLALGVIAFLILRLTQYKKLFAPEPYEEGKMYFSTILDSGTRQSEADGSYRLSRASAPLSNGE
uniref:TIGR00374 family protein n=1 Tax=Thermogemmatispora argillosa TaxID=2045280 RepID=A0A455T6A0_9CHLR|nr:TIGR00374 family protein [Thermogemmatispora argillosa]